MSQESKDRRARNRAAGLAALRRHGGLSIQRKNHGAHLIVTTSNRVVFDYWPGTGNWLCRSDDTGDRGISSFMNRLKQEETKI